MRAKKEKFLPGSYAILAELAEAARIFEVSINAGLRQQRNLQKYEEVSAEAEDKLDALALQNPEEATRIFAASPYFDEDIQPDEIYLGHGIIISRDYYKKHCGTIEARQAYIREYLEG